MKTSLKACHNNSRLWTLLCALIFLTFDIFAVEISQHDQTIKVTQSGQGSPVILIPGLMSDGSVWQDIAKKLSRKHQVHVVSLAGFAGTPKAENFSLEHVKQSLTSYIKTNNLHKPAIIGHSLGGFLSFWLASSSPELVGDIISVDGLPYIAPVFTRTNDSTVESMAGQAQYIRSLYNNMNASQLAAQTRQGIFIQATSAQSQERIIGMAKQSDPKTVGRAIFELMSTDLRPALKDISSRVLLIGASGAFNQTSQKDQVELLYKQQLAAAPQAKLVMNTQDRHFIMFDNAPWLLAQINQFLEG